MDRWGDEQARAVAHSGFGQLTALLAMSNEAIALLDAHARVSGWNVAAQDLLGWSSADLLGQPLAQTVFPDSADRFEQAWAELASSSDAQTVSVIARTASDVGLHVTLRLAGVAHFAQLAGAVVMMRADPVSAGRSSVGHATVLLGHDDLVRRLTTPVPPGSSRAVAVMDVDGLAQVNATHGRDAGDVALRQLADRLARVAAGASFGQWDDDEFVLVLDDPNARGRMTALMKRLQQAASEAIVLDEQLIRLSFSAGLATGEAGERRGLLMAAADALNLAKLTGRDRSVWFEDSMQAANGADARLAEELRRGIEEGELRLHFQPIIDLSSNTWWGVEALVRWERPGVGLVQPSGFIELAERSGNILALGAWVTLNACNAGVELASPVTLPIRVSINISGEQLIDPGVVDMLSTSLQASGCAPGLVEVEVTETALLHDLAAARETLLAMKSLGVGLSLDDFGTGYSSLVYLKNFPVDHIKIDRSFVAGLGENPDDTAIIASTVSLAHSVGVRCVAEGVESAEQLALLREMGCDYAQGFFIGRPMPLEQLWQWQPPALSGPPRAPRNVE